MSTLCFPLYEIGNKYLQESKSTKKGHTTRRQLHQSLIFFSISFYKTVWFNLFKWDWLTEKKDLLEYVPLLNSSMISIIALLQ